MNKKQYALVFGITDNYAFALGNVLLGLKKHCKNINFDIFVYNQQLNEKDKQVLNSILECNFIEYSFPEINVKMQEPDSMWLNRFSELAFARYECFDYLNNYKKVAWLDVDLLIQKDIQNLFDQCSDNIALYQEGLNLKGLFLKEVDFISDNQNFYYNSGVLVLADTISNKEQLKEWCYRKTVELAEVIKLPDQAILNLMLREFPDIKVINLDERFNCYPRNPENKRAVILHSYSYEKFWNFYNFKEWNDNNKKWIKMGGTPFSGVKSSFLHRILKPHYPTIPDPLRRPRDFFKYIKSETTKLNMKSESCNTNK